MRNCLNCEKYCNVKANVNVNLKDTSREKLKIRKDDLNELFLLFRKYVYLFEYT